MFCLYFVFIFFNFSKHYFLKKNIHSNASFHIFRCFLSNPESNLTKNEDYMLIGMIILIDSIDLLF